VSTEETKQTPAVGSRRWLLVQATALLASVATQNYVCFGGGPVPRYGLPPPPTPAADPAGLVLTLMLQDAAGKTRLECPGLELSLRDATVRHLVWTGYEAARRLQTIWVWDFYRIQSHIALRVRVPAGDVSEKAAVAWKETLDAVRALKPGDQIVVDVKSACGDIHQSHALSAAPVEWSPGL